MLRMKGRLAKLEEYLIPVQGPTKRWVVVMHGGGPANLANSTCTRRLSNGVLMEVVQLDGSREGVTDEELDRFVQSFPIQGRAAAC
jgi:hypothetical protein